VHNAAKSATYNALDHSNVDELVTFLKDAVKPHTDKVDLRVFSTLEDRVGIGMDISLFIATKVPEKRDKEYKSEECVTSLMIAVCSPSLLTSSFPASLH
jgi:hypothetical protein